MLCVCHAGEQTWRLCIHPTVSVSALCTVSSTFLLGGFLSASSNVIFAPPTLFLMT